MHEVPKALRSLMEGLTGRAAETQLRYSSHIRTDCRLSYRLMSWMQVVGSLWQPEIMHEAPVALRALVEGPTGRATATQLLYSPQSRAAVALCRSSIPPERAAAWVEGLLSHVEAKHIVFVASLPVSAFSRPVHPVICALVVTCHHGSFHTITLSALLPIEGCAIPPT